MTDNKDHDMVFFPLVFLPAHEMESTLKLFKWCWDHEIDIHHTCDSIAMLRASKVIAPGQQGGGAMATVTFFYGRCDEENFKKIFGFDYSFENIPQIQPFILNELGIENPGLQGIG